MNKKISIIVPVYNGEKTVVSSLQTLINQSIDNYEIIVVNDGSTDNTKEIIDNLRKEHPDLIKVKHTNNQGAAMARNVALEMAEGEYIGFFDSDDFVAFDMYEKLYNEAKNKNADISVCGYYLVSNENIRSFQNGNMEYYDKSIYESPDIFVYGVPYLWNKIFKKEIIDKNNIKFNNFRIFEDLEFTYKMYFLANKIVKVDEPLYYYMRTGLDTLTSKFTDRFFDIMPSISSLISYCKEHNIYEQFQDYLLFVCLNHMYLRMNVPVNLHDVKLKFKYIDDCFDYLDHNFPNWKCHNYYFENKNKNKNHYISKTWWKSRTFFLKYRSFLVKKYKTLRKIGGVILKPRPGAKYNRYCKKYKIDENSILLDSQHGNDVNGNIFYILKTLQKERYKQFKIYISFSKTRYDEFKNKIGFYSFNNVVYVENNSNEYSKILATAKYLFNDTSFPPYFTKRPGQVYLNTWHGTPLKTLGRKTKEDFYNICNLQRNFSMADYLLYPSKYMMDHMIEDYMIDNISKNKILLSGYPRNTIFFDDKRRNKIKDNLGINNKEIIVYMPTWRGTLNNKDNDEYIVDLENKLKIISSKLNNDQVLYLNVHPYVKDYIHLENLTNIRMFPKEYETYDFLNCADILITDYSSVFYDFANTRKKIILFVYDKDKYLRERGLYIDFDELPFPKVQNIDELMKTINDKKTCDYRDFIDEYAKYDSPMSADNICDLVLFEKTNDTICLDTPRNDRENILCSAKSLCNFDINKKLFYLIFNSNISLYNYYLTFINASLFRHKKLLLYLPDNFNYLGQLYRYPLASFLDCALIYLYSKFNFIYKLFGNKIKSLFMEEYKRIYGEKTFSINLLVGENTMRRLSLFALSGRKTILYYPKGSKLNRKIPAFIYELLENVIVEDVKEYDFLKNKSSKINVSLANNVKNLESLLKH